MVKISGKRLAFVVLIELTQVCHDGRTRLVRGFQYAVQGVSAETVRSLAVASFGLADYSQVAVLGSRYIPVNFGA